MIWLTHGREHVNGLQQNGESKDNIVPSQDLVFAAADEREFWLIYFDSEDPLRITFLRRVEDHDRDSR